MKEKASRKLANGQNIDYSEKENGPRASSAPALGLNTILFKHVYWYMQQISGERLQDHWSSGVGLTIYRSASRTFLPKGLAFIDLTLFVSTKKKTARVRYFRF